MAELRPGDTKRGQGHKKGSMFKSKVLDHRTQKGVNVQI
jgi:hypothetical protein